MTQKPESTLQALLPQLEAKARADAEKHVLALANKIFLRNFVAEHRDKIEALLAEDKEL